MSSMVVHINSWCCKKVVFLWSWWNKCFLGTYLDLFTLFQYVFFFHVYLKKIQCCAHHTNLGMQVLSHLPMVSCVELLLHFLYTFFGHNSKKHNEFITLVALLWTRSCRMLKLVGYLFCHLLKKSCQNTSYF
jgi:hypothetical protein